MVKKFIKNILGRTKIKEEVIYINILDILRGAEGDDLTGLEYVQMTGDKFRTSTRGIDSPQVQLLQDYEKISDAVFKPDYFINTSYYKNAFESICYLGDYFPAAKRPEDVVKVAERFVYSYLERVDLSKYDNRGHNKYEESIIVRPIIGSKCFQIISGNHRVASAFMKGKKNIEAIVRKNEATHTYFTDLISKVIWDEGTALYQPINLPELNHLPLIRKCQDRFERMINYLNEEKVIINNKSLIDIGSYYGWFVNQFTKKGVKAFGLERDFSACKVAVELNGLPDDIFINKPLEEFVLNDNKQYDIILFLSVLHHFSLGKSFMSDVFVLKKLAERTKSFMFFDTGEEHETMFGNALKGWNEQTIKEFILLNTDFKEVISLGRDSDNVGKHLNDYRRMLFVLKK